MGKKVKSIKILNVIDIDGRATELFWVNGQLIENTTKGYLAMVSNTVRGSRKRIGKNQSLQFISQESRDILTSHVKNMTNNGKLKLKNFSMGNCQCDLCLNELPIIIKVKKDLYPTTPSSWVDYIGL